jgi:hypothetical protein
MSEASTAFMAGRLSTETCNCNSFNLDRIFGNDTRLQWVEIRWVAQRRHLAIEAREAPRIAAMLVPPTRKPPESIVLGNSVFIHLSDPMNHPLSRRQQLRKSVRHLPGAGSGLSLFQMSQQALQEPSAWRL